GRPRFGVERARRGPEGDPALRCTPGAGARGRSQVSAAGPGILIVEDDPTARRALATNLAAHAYEVRTAADGEEALRQWELRRPDALLLDLGLPGIDGISVVRRIRREATTLIIVVSARGREADRVAALDAGADD